MRLLPCGCWPFSIGSTRDLVGVEPAKNRHLLAHPLRTCHFLQGKASEDTTSFDRQTEEFNVLAPHWACVTAEFKAANGLPIDFQARTTSG